MLVTLHKNIQNRVSFRVNNLSRDVTSAVFLVRAVCTLLRTVAARRAVHACAVAADEALVEFVCLAIVLVVTTRTVVVAVAALYVAERDSLAGLAETSVALSGVGAVLFVRSISTIVPTITHARSTHARAARAPEEVAGC